MDDLEYMIKLKEAKEIAYNQRLENKLNPIKDKWIKVLFCTTLIFGVLNVVKIYADYTVKYYTCSICSSNCSSPSCCPNAHFCEWEYEVKGEPPQ